MNIILAEKSHSKKLAEIIKATFHLACPESSDRNLQSIYTTKHLSAQSFKKLIDDERHKVWAAVDSKELVGFAVMVMDSDELPMLSKLYILPDYHGKRFAPKLCKAVIDYAKIRRYKALNLLVYSGNLKAKAFYEKQGFKLIGSCDFHMETEVHKDHLYQLLLA